MVEQHRSILPQSPANQNNAQDSGALLDLLEKHLDPMLHEASIGRSTYTPDTSLPPPASPVFVLSSVAGQDEQAAPPGGTQQAVDAFLAEITTPPPSSSRFSQHWGLRNKVTISTQRQSAQLATKAKRSSNLETITQEILANKFGVFDDNKRLDEHIK